MLAYVLPTRNRPRQLGATLTALGDLPAHPAQVIVVDNGSRPAARVPAALSNGIEVRVVRRPRNEGAAGRNAGVRAADGSCEWVVMLDDDSHPTDLGVLKALHEAGQDVAVVAAEISLPEQGRREAGGLPEVFIGCGAAIRRRAFLEAGGYDAAFDYYAEEYDLSARLLLAGWRVTLDRRFRVAHHKVAQGRDMNRILRRLVRNNGWVAQRYAPEARRGEELAEVITRYGSIAQRERAGRGYWRGRLELAATLRRQTRTPMSEALFDRFTGLDAARRALQEAYWQRPFETAAVVNEGKNSRLVRQAVREIGATIIENEREAQVLVIGTLSPGPMLDALDRWGGAAGLPHAHRRRVIAPWPGLATSGGPAASVPAAA